MIFAKRVFLVAGVYGLAALLPLYFLEARLGAEMPPPITHPEHYYGFVGVAVSWQVLFLLIARDPRRYRPVMVPAVLEKLSYGLAVAVLFAQGRVAAPVLATGVVDLLLAGLFVAAFQRAAPAASP